MKIEKNADAQLGRSFEFALPKEWSRQEQIQYTTNYIQKTFVDRGMCADWSIHDKGDGNPHVHLLLTMRPFNPDHSWGKKEVKDWDFLRDKNGNIVIDESHPNWWQDKKNPDRHGIRIPVLDENGIQKMGARNRLQWKRVLTDANGWNNPKNCELWRSEWAKVCNEHLPLHNQVDHRSYGQDPYHGPGQAMGLSFSVPNGEKLPPSLRNIYKEMISDLGCNMPVSGDLSAWAQQGVLLLNTTLTVREHAANSHSKLGWQVVTTAIVEACMRLPQPVVFLAWGRPAIKLIESAKARVSKDALEGGAGVAGSGSDDPATSGTAPAVADESGSSAGDALSRKFILKSTHPSPLSASRAAGDLPAFLGSRPFSRANDLLRECGAESIDWQLAG